LGEEVDNGVSPCECRERLSEFAVPELRKLAQTFGASVDRSSILRHRIGEANES
jgi:hypothetical protein